MRPLKKSHFWTYSGVKWVMIFFYEKQQTKDTPKPQLKLDLRCLKKGEALLYLETTELKKKDYICIVRTCNNLLNSSTGHSPTRGGKNNNAGNSYSYK